jgi:hypothetical protein
MGSKSSSVKRLPLRKTFDRIRKVLSLLQLSLLQLSLLQLSLLI